MTQVTTENQTKTKKKNLDVRPGDRVRVFQKIKEGDKERIQAFEGIVVGRKHGKGISATITIRKIVSEIGVERIFPLHSPLIEKIEVVKRSRIRRAKLYYLRKKKGRKIRLKKRKIRRENVKEKESFSKRVNIETEQPTKKNIGVEDSEKKEKP